MYIEIFLLDNLLLNLLIVRLAAVMLSVRPPLYRQTGAAFISALTAALAAYKLPWLGSPLLRLPLLALISAAIPFKGAKGLIIAMSATLVSTLIVGGGTFALALIDGGGFENGSISGGITLRTMLISLALMSLIPSAIRRILRRRLAAQTSVRVLIAHKGILRRFDGIIDTGNTLAEPVSGMSVVIVRCPALKRFAKIPVPTTTAAGRTWLMCFQPDSISVDGREVECMVALTDERLSAEAVVPPEVCGFK